ncbi:MAG: sensor histidine kinase, partial [Burkholderiales bacterium]|nr:sensor histidine kinase [Burkholderiales bacterium]
MKRAVTLSERVTWALAGAVAAFVALQGVLVYVLLAGQEDDLVDSIVLAETQRLAQRLATEDDVFPAVGAMEMGSNLRAWIQ